jgi:hypothetical protein
LAYDLKVAEKTSLPEILKTVQPRGREKAGKAA